MPPGWPGPSSPLLQCFQEHLLRRLVLSLLSSPWLLLFLLVLSHLSLPLPLCQ